MEIFNLYEQILCVSEGSLSLLLCVHNVHIEGILTCMDRFYVFLRAPFCVALYAQCNVGMGTFGLHCSWTDFMCL